jgi:hypothetical protein
MAETHHPLIRAMHIEWIQEPDGVWVASEERDERRWEVVCGQCGDDGGAPTEQTGNARRLRGPFSRDKAQEIAELHTTNPNAVPSDAAT